MKMELKFVLLNANQTFVFWRLSHRGRGHCDVFQTEAHLILFKAALHLVSSRKERQWSEYEKRYVTFHHLRYQCWHVSITCIAVYCFVRVTASYCQIKQFLLIRHEPTMSVLFSAFSSTRKHNSNLWRPLILVRLSVYINNKAQCSLTVW